MVKKYLFRYLFILIPGLFCFSVVYAQIDSLRNIAEIKSQDSLSYSRNDLIFFRNYLEEARSENSKEDIILAYQLLAAASYATNDTRQALKYYKLYAIELEELTNAKEFRKQQFEKNLYENEIKALNATIKELEAEISTLTAEKEEYFSQNYLIYFGLRVVFAIALLLALGWLYQRFRKPKKIGPANEARPSKRNELSNQLNQSKAHIIELETQLNLSDILVNKVLISSQEYFEDNKSLHKKFLVDLPAALSSGAGLFLKTRRNHTIISVFKGPAIGAAGGLISNHIYQSIEAIVSHLTIFSPALILEELEQKLTTLFPVGVPFTGGIEIAVCSYDSIEKKILFSGAGIPLFETRKGVVQKFESSKSSLLDNESHHIFQNEVISVEKGSNYYLSTTSFWRQPGGHNYKPLGENSYRKTIESMTRQPLVGHKLVLEKLYSEWLGSNEQEADVLIFGFGL